MTTRIGTGAPEAPSTSQPAAGRSATPTAIVAIRVGVRSDPRLTMSTVAPDSVRVSPGVRYSV